jgi:hypothetical protein
MREIFMSGLGRGRWRRTRPDHGGERRGRRGNPPAGVLPTYRRKPALTAPAPHFTSISHCREAKGLICPFSLFYANNPPRKGCYMARRGLQGVVAVLVGLVLVGLLAGISLIGASSPGTRGASNGLVPAQRVQAATPAHPSPESAALAHAGKQRSDWSGGDASVVFQFPEDDQRVRVRVTSGAWCRVFTVRVIDSDPGWVANGPGAECEG